MASTGAFFIDYHPETGQPFLGYLFNGDGVGIQLFLADKLSAEETLKTFTSAVETLMGTTPQKTTPKIIEAKGPLPKGPHNARVR